MRRAGVLAAIVLVTLFWAFLATALYSSFKANAQCQEDGFVRGESLWPSGDIVCYEGIMGTGEAE